MLEGSLELCRLEALWHRAKAPHLTPHRGEGGREGSKEGRKEGWNDRELDSCRATMGRKRKDPGMMERHREEEEKST